MTVVQIPGTGVPIMKSLRRAILLTLEAHLVTSRPGVLRYGFAAAGRDSFLVHGEARIIAPSCAAC
jgi:pentose-5-phosphate-3-epimerase